MWSYLTLRASRLYNLGDYEAAVAVARQATRTQVVDLTWPLVHLAASLGRINRKDEAATVISELRELRPGLNIGQFRTWPHNQHRAKRALENIITGLRAAGLPE